jgi:hypothetical protein
MVGKITTLPKVVFCFVKWFSKKWRRVRDGVLGGYCRGMMEFRVLEGYYRGNDDDHV